jgi:hypothetical protein
MDEYRNGNAPVQIMDANAAVNAKRYDTLCYFLLYPDSNASQNISETTDGTRSYHYHWQFSTIYEGSG